MCRKDLVKFSSLENVTKLVVSRTTVKCCKNIYLNIEGFLAYIALPVFLNSCSELKTETGSSGRYILGVCYTKKTT